MILKRTADIWTELIEAINSAESEILFQTFYIDNDASWLVFADALINKSKTGVKITCLFDALGSHEFTDASIEKTMRDAGIQISYFNWLSPFSSRNKSLWYFRNHKRSLIIDRKILHIGGWCIGDKTKDWMDAHVKTTNIKIIETALSDFERMNTFADKMSFRIRGEKRRIYTQFDDEDYVYQSPFPRSRYIVYSYIQLLKNAHKTITLIAPYFAPTGRFIHQIIKARKRGVLVNIILPKKTDHAFIDIAAQTFFEKLLRFGVRIYIAPHMNHAKIGLIDDVAYIGSMNLDPVSIRFNFENGIFTKDIKIVEELSADIQSLINNCEQLNWSEWNRRSVWQKCKEWFVRLFRGFL